MFETSVVHAPLHAARGKFSLFSISVIAHSAVILGAIGVSIASVDFPRLAPDEFAQAPIFLPVMQIPPPLGTPDGGAAPRPEPARPADTPPPPQQPNQVTAPPATPDEIPQLNPPSTNNSAGNNSSEITGAPGPAGSGNGPLGQPWGDPNSVGPIDGPPVDMPGQPIVQERIYQPHEVKAPVAIYRPAPAYPEMMRRARLKASVTVRCVIDKNGRVRDPQIIAASPFAAFNDAVVQAVQQWRFKPGAVGDQAVESYLDLTVRFSTE